MLLLPLLIVLAAAPAPAAKPHPYTVMDQVNLRRLLAFAVSADGKNVVLTVRATDYEANKGKLDLWAMHADGTGLRPLTTHPAPDTDPVFAPDGKSVYFLSGRSNDTNQIFNLSLEGGEPVQVTKSPVDVNAFILSNDGTRLVFAAEVFADCAEPDTLACTEKRLAEAAKKKATGKLYDKLMYRHWDTWSDGRRSHLFVQPAQGGAAKDLMPKLDADAPVKPFGGAEQFVLTPDGKTLVFTAKDVGREESWSTDLDLFAVPCDGSAAPKKITVANRATDTNPSFSPDGKTLAYLAMARPGYEADKLTLILRTLDGKERRLTDGWDHSVEDLTWSPDGKTLYVTAWDLGQQALFGIDAASGKVTPVVPAGHVTAMRAVGSQLFYLSDSLRGPAELYVFEGGESKRLTHLNQEAMANIRLGEPEQFSFAGWNGEKVFGYVVKPVDFDAKKKYPIAFLIHGGPQGSFGNDWHYRWNPQVYAAHGYAAVMIDFHGSTGYGQAFTDAIRGDWGGKPLEDLQKGYAAALEKYPFLDKSRACALGASYGGYMINWIEGLWPEPWKCLVSHDGNLDEAFAYFATEELWFPEWEHGGTPWQSREGYAKHNPVDHIDQWKVPTLVVHGGKDYRVVDTEGLATFTALQRKGIPSKLLYFPDENHWVLKPQNSVLWHDTVLGWMDQWTKK